MFPFVDMGHSIFFGICCTTKCMYIFRYKSNVFKSAGVPYAVGKDNFAGSALLLILRELMPCPPPLIWEIYYIGWTCDVNCYCWRPAIGKISFAFVKHCSEKELMS